MKTILITGVSSGIGEALVRAYASDACAIIGIGRSCSFSAANFRFVPCDLSDRKAVEALQLDLSNASELLLFNNAGMIGEISRLSEQSSDICAVVLQVNTLAPIELTRQVAVAAGDQIPLTVVNISSGAGRRAIPSWLAYCTSKAALDMFSEVFYAEEQERGRNTRVYAVAPGVVDTGMQAQIRSADSSHFSALDHFTGLKTSGGLESTDEIARKLRLMLDLPYAGEVIVSLRDY
jgi:benzil reductase ((S)-benzoin forming)